MSNQAPITLCRYWVKADQEERFKELLRLHWPTFEKLGLVTDSPAHLIFRGEDKEKGIYYVETFPWKDADASRKAHEHAEVMEIWGPMGECCSAMEFPPVTLVEV